MTGQADSNNRMERSDGESGYAVNAFQMVCGDECAVFKCVKRVYRRVVLFEPTLGGSDRTHGGDLCVGATSSQQPWPYH